MDNQQKIAAEIFKELELIFLSDFNEYDYVIMRDKYFSLKNKWCGNG